MGLPDVIRTTLFSAGTGGYATFRIPGIVTTARGTLLVYCEARKAPRGDWGTIDVLTRRSEDGGDSWSDPELLPHLAEAVPRNPAAVAQGLAPTGEQTYNNPVAIASAGGAVHFVHCVQYARCLYRRSDDDGRSWSDPVDITAVFGAYRPGYPWQVIATGPGHGIQLASGRLLIPVWLSTGTGGHAHRPSCVSTIYSDDEGSSWHRAAIVATDSPETPNPSESAIAELGDGRVMLHIRNESLRHLRLVSLSPDGASGWTIPYFDPFLFEPVCAASLVRVPPFPGCDTGLLVFANPDSRGSAAAAVDRVSQPRENLVLRASLDDGRSWLAPRVLDPGPAGYSDLGVGHDTSVYCFYERGSVGEGRTVVRELALARLHAGGLLLDI